MSDRAAALAGVSIARRLVLAGAALMVRTPVDRLPLVEGEPVDGEEWPLLDREMREYENAPDRAIAEMRDGFGLSALDCWLVLLCAAVERYPEVAAALGMLMDEAHAHLMTPMCFARLMHAARGVAIDDALSAALAGGHAARRGLLECGEAPGRPHTHQPLRLAMTQVQRLAARDAEPQAESPRERLLHARAFDGALVRVGTGLLQRSGALCLRGPSPRALRQYALDVASALGIAPTTLSATDPRELQSVLRLHSKLPIVDLTDTAIASGWRAALADAATLADHLLVLVRDSSPDIGLPSLTVPRLGWPEAERVWHAITGDADLARRLAARFRVNAAEADAACRHADDLDEVLPDPSRVRAAVIATHVLEEGARRMGRLVTHLRSEAALADLVVPHHLREQLTDILDWQRHSPRVFGEMAIGRRSPLGRGLTCLFSGAPGTGKTFAAQCVANELGLNLYRIDLSQVVSKYIGETEKALATVFDEAESGHGVLLFDEADALFGKRSEVKDAHDRYANIEVGYLLQRLEAFDGVAILATNLRGNMDPAFVRRMRFMLDFPMPDAEMRRQLWEQSLPAHRFRADDLSLAFFVDRFRLSGGSIQNISLAAAHMAAATPDGQVRLAHLVRATYRELEKAGQTRDRASFGDFAEYLPREVA